ncbi:hypothetical protein ACIRU8_39405 [Streptomyces sp. NPDC101175]|uniref:DUF7739 domain-containing protein n=1 Tax=Streptomyces sp. NPDC101175 TaxID=3366123 RepID=UPI003833399D
MGISISHGGPSACSATAIANLGQHLAHALTGSEWGELSGLFGGGFSDIASIPPARAGRIGELLHKAARHRLMSGEWGRLANLIGDAAQSASRAGRNWTWS